MKTQQRLADWLARKDRDYKKGVQLFIDLNIDVDKVPYFSTDNYDRMHESILFKQLYNYARVNKIKPQKFESSSESGSVSAGGKKNRGTSTGINSTKETTTQKVKVDTNPVVRFEELPANLQVKFTTNGDLKNQNKTYHAELKLIADDSDKSQRREELAKAIVANEKAVRENWELIDSWWNERLKVTPEEQAAKEALLKEKRIRANLNYIRRYHGTEKDRQLKEMKIRKKELDKWGVDYEELIRKISKSSAVNEK